MGKFIFCSMIFFFHVITTVVLPDAAGNAAKFEAFLKFALIFLLYYKNTEFQV